MKKLSALIVVLFSAVATAASARQLVWDEATPQLVDHYNVYESLTVPPSWSFLMSTDTTAANVPDSAPQLFFAVTAVGFDGSEVPQISNSR